jgi:uroporphyrin-III C-methyltransferase
MKHGKVFLIGAGPGDVELLTLKAVRAIGRAQVLFIDDLVNREVLQFAQPNARIIEVGKRGGCKSTPQAFIERQMIAAARRGATVARVKGGDPFVFGRGGEEVQALRAAGIEVEVVNGITAGLAAATSIGVPLTHRDLSHGVTFVTGHAREGGDAPDWPALARAATTLVIYMGMSNLDSIARALLAGGRAADTPVAVIQNATLKDQRELISTLRGIARAARAAELGSPAIVVVGEVVSLAQPRDLAWLAMQAA